MYFINLLVLELPGRKWIPNMPYYDYECPKCNKIKEIERSIKSLDEPVLCDCGNKMDKLISIVSIRFKGDGWQSNDVKDKGN